MAADCIDALPFGECTIGALLRCIAAVHCCGALPSANAPYANAPYANAPYANVSFVRIASAYEAPMFPLHSGTGMRCTRLKPLPDKAVPVIPVVPVLFEQVSR